MLAVGVVFLNGFIWQFLTFISNEVTIDRYNLHKQELLGLLIILKV